ncbi:hypothetical protein F5I97DRAFT_1935292 [Phlebopus sp. FC_14]|nr:hypothetical protein F5I97DRAFT_1935292 [Phlebopus sp. FC_14]
MGLQEATTPSGFTSKKRKHSSVAGISDHVSHTGHKPKKGKRDKTQNQYIVEANTSKSKGKSRASDSPSEFHVIGASIVLSVPPVFANDLRAGVEEMLDSMVMRYIPSLRGVLLAHSNLQFLSKTASIRGDCPFAICHVSFDATVWSPCVSMKLVGKINLCSPDHVSLLVHRTFNVSIPRHHIPQDQWVFEYGPAENDPEYGEGRELGSSGGEGWVDESSKEELVKTADGDAEMQDVDNTDKHPGETESSGRWVHHLTGCKLGDPDGYLEFTVIGLTVANEMLSLQGSIQPDPFAPEHTPHASNQHDDSRASTPSSPTVQAQASSHSDSSSRRNFVGQGEEVEEDDEDGDFGEDGFADLAKLTDEATARAKREKEEAERAAKKAKKRKHREEIGASDDVTKRRNEKKKKKEHAAAS